MSRLRWLTFPSILLLISYKLHKLFKLINSFNFCMLLLVGLFCISFEKYNYCSLFSCFRHSVHARMAKVFRLTYKAINFLLKLHHANIITKFFVSRMKYLDKVCLYNLGNSFAAKNNNCY